MQFEYSALEALAAVVQEGTFEAAAKLLGITQSAVSQRIKQLEERSGAVLVVRGRPCVATEYGQQLCRHVEQVQLLEHELDRNLLSIDTPSAARPAVIRITVNNDSLATWFPAVIRRAGTELNVRFDIYSEDQEYSEQRLRSGDALAVVTTSDKPLQGCRRVSLGAMEYVAVASRKFVDTHFRDGVTLKALEAAPLIAFNRKDSLPSQWLMRAFGEEVPLAGHNLPSFSGYMACCLNGTGWGMMPRVTVVDALREGALVELMPNKPVLVSLHWQSSVQGSEIMRLLSAIVVAEARKSLSADVYRD